MTSERDEVAKKRGKEAVFDLGEKIQAQHEGGVQEILNKLDLPEDMVELRSIPGKMVTVICMPDGSAATVYTREGVREESKTLRVETSAMLQILGEERQHLLIKAFNVALM